jgi:hypothetical protein
VFRRWGSEPDAAVDAGPAPLPGAPA